MNRFCLPPNLTALFLSVFVVVTCNGADSISVVSWNIRNYTLSDRMVDGVFRKNYPKPQKEKQALREVLAELEPDIVFLQEIGGIAYLKELAADLSYYYGIDYEETFVVESEDRVRKIGMLSKYPVDTVREVKLPSFRYVDGRSQVKRGLLRADVTLDGKSVSFYTFHLKSRLTTYAEDPGSQERRVKEATVIRDKLRLRIESELQRIIVALGDLNDHANSGTYRRFIEVNRSPLLPEIQVEDEDGLSWTYHNTKRRSYEQIDFVFSHIPTDLKDSIQIEGRVVNHGLVKDASDHRPLWIELSSK